MEGMDTRCSSRLDWEESAYHGTDRHTHTVPRLRRTTRSEERETYKVDDPRAEEKDVGVCASGDI